MDSTSRGPHGSLLKFFSITYVVTWALWIGAGTLSGRVTALERVFLFLPGTLAPGLVALALTWRAEGRSGAHGLLSRLFQWRVGLRWYGFAIGYMAAIKLATAVVIRVVAGSWPAFGSQAWYLMFAAAIFSTVIGGQSGEEIGWRGYALPRLAVRFGLARASLLLGVIWAAWHLPLFFIPGTDLIGQSFVIYLLAVIPLSVAIAWLWWRTERSLLLTMLMHAAVNNTTGIVPAGAPLVTSPWVVSTSLVGWISVGLLWLGAVVFLVQVPKGKDGLANVAGA